MSSSDSSSKPLTDAATSSPSVAASSTADNASDSDDMLFTGLRAAIKTTAQGVAVTRVMAEPWCSEMFDTTDRFGVALGTDPFARYFAPPEVLALGKQPEAVKRLMKLRGGGVHPWVWARTRYIDLHFCAALADKAAPLRGLSTAVQALPTVSQVIILGAGMDTRLYRFRQQLDARNVRRFEMDLPPTQAEKQSSMQQAAKEQGDIGIQQVTYLPMDLRSSLEEQVAQFRAAGVDSSLPTLFVWEGVTAYLPESAIEQSLELMRVLGAPGSRLLITFLTPEREKNKDAKLLRAQHPNEPRLFLPTLEHMQSLLAQHKWAVRDFADPATLSKLFINHTAETWELPVPEGTYIALAEHIV